MPSRRSPTSRRRSPPSISPSSSNQRFSHEELKNLHSACEDWGFFYLINHGVSGEVIEKMKMDVKEFFRQPLEVKEVHA
ncbi:S-norcoclaurine synthase 1 [Acorus calamus]|uniref:S-norcoclaurine synthase 1 n=1 Tax=Acorus calamus TaxID=4465 RepID=A0AAV9DU48_ACOCL|nr:S-norcoclaurine synthase 1 [Acorus calamus]